MHPFLIDFTFAGLRTAIPTFMVFIIAGIGLFVLLLAWLHPPLRKMPLRHTIFFGAIFLGAALSAKTGQTVIELLDPANAGIPWYVVVAQAGSTVTTGMLGGIAVLGWFLWKDPVRIVDPRLLDATAAAFPLAHMMGRLGCFFNGCCYGAVCDHDFPLGVTYPDNWIALGKYPDLATGPRWPSPLLEAAGLLVIGAALILAHRNMHRKGLLPGIYMILYGILRFLVETTRGDVIRGIHGGLATGQWFALVLGTLGILVLAGTILKDRKNPLSPGKSWTGQPLAETDL